MILKSINGYFYYSCIDPFIFTIEMHIIELNNIKTHVFGIKDCSLGMSCI